MRQLLTKAVNKWFSKEKDIDEGDLLKATQEIIDGLYEASLGGGLYKKRIANSSVQGQSGGSRVIIAYKGGNNVFFMYAFNKNDKGNISDKELKALKLRAKMYFGFNDEALDKAIENKVFYEIGGGEDE